jgi:hypothetical protein
MLYVFLLVPLLSSWNTGYAQLFRQNFSSSTVTNNYISTSPTNGQFTDIRSTGSGTTVNIANGGIEITRTTGELGYFVRNTDFANNPSSLIIQFTFQAPSANLSDANVGKFSIGGDFANNGATTANANEFASFGFYLTGVSNQFGIRNINTSTSNSTIFTGAQTITWVLNKSGTTLAYVGPDGSSQTVGSDRWDIWVGSTQVFNEQNVITASQPLTQFKFRTEPTSASMNYTLRFDNFYMNTIGGSLPSGTYTLGPDGDFQSLTNTGGVFNILNNLGSVTAGGYTFQVASDLTENGTHALNQLSGMSAANKIRIVPSNTTVRSISGGVNGMIKLSGADYVEFEGGTGTSKFLRFRNDGLNTFIFSNDATNNKITNCFVESDNPQHDIPPFISYGIVFFGSGTTTGNSFNTIQNCELSGAYGSNKQRKPLSAINSYTAGSARNTGNIVSDNLIYEFGGYGNGSVSAIHANTGSSNWTISRNTFYFNTDVSAAVSDFNDLFTMINLQDGSDYTVEGNIIGGTSITGGQTTMRILESTSGFFKVRGIIVDLKSSNNTAQITNNTIRGIAQAYSSSSGTSLDEEAFIGIDIISGNVTASTNTIQNITTTCNPTTTTVSRRVRGIKASSNATVLVSSNTISGLNISSSNSSTLNAAVIQGVSLHHTSGTTSIQSNAISNISSSAGTIAAISREGSGTALINSNDYNNLTQSNTSNSAFLRGIRNVGAGTVTINSNSINTLSSTSLNSSTTDPAVSAILVTSGTVNISQNTIHTILATNGSNSGNNHAAGMTLTGTTTVSGNRIYNISNSSGGDNNAATGIIVHSGAHTLTNNMISMGMGVSASTNNSDLIPFYGIWNATTATSLNVYYNSVHIGGENRQGNSRSYNTFCFYRGTGVTTPVIIMNNLFQNLRLFNENTNNDDPKAKHYAICSDETANWSSGSVTVCNGVPSSSVNYNALFCLSSSRIGRWAGVSRSYAGWQTASGGDAQSVDLGFNSATSITFANVNTADLHVASTVTNNVLSSANLVLDQKGAALTSVPSDFDNDFRRAPSDIGADEFSRIIYSAATGNWTSGSSWSQGGVPTFWDEIVIMSGHNIVVPANTLAQFYRLTIQNGGTLRLADNTSVLEGSILYNTAVGARGEFTIANGGTFNANATGIGSGNVRLAGRLTNNSSSFNSSTGTFFMNFDDILVNESCASTHILNLNKATAISDINGTANTTFNHLTLLNNANTSVIAEPALLAAKTITVNNILDIQGTGIFAIGGSSVTNTNTLAIGSSAVNGTITGTGTLSGSIFSNLHILGTTGNVSTNPVAFTNGFRLLNNLWIERQNAIDAITLGTGGVTVSGRLTLSRGHINTLLIPWSSAQPNNLNASLLTLDVDAVVNGGISGGSDNSYVNGPMAKITNSTSSFSFPVGNIDILGRIGITPTSTSSNRATFIARYYKQDPSLTYSKSVQTPTNSDPVNDLDHVSEREYWMLDKTDHGSTAVRARVRLHWTSYSLVYFWNSAEWAGLRVARFNGSTWESRGPYQDPATFSPNANIGSSGYVPGNSYSAGSIESDEVTNFSPFTFGTTIMLRLNPLPVELLTLKALAQHKQINVEWITATESNSDYFIVERSTDAKNFKPIGKVAAAGTSKTVRTYALADKHPYPGINYYRLQQVDKEGSAQISHVVSAEMVSSSLSGKFEIYPNPSDGKYLTIQLPYQGEMIVSIYNAVGAEIEMQKIVADGRIATLQPRTSLASGIYIIKIVTAKGSYQQKIIIR